MVLRKKMLIKTMSTVEIVTIILLTRAMKQYKAF